MKKIILSMGLLVIGLTGMAQVEEGIVGQARGAVAQECGPEALSNQNVKAIVHNGCLYDGPIVVSFVRPFYVFPTCPPGQNCPVIPPPPPPCDYIIVARASYTCSGELISVECNVGCPDINF